LSTPLPIPGGHDRQVARHYLQGGQSRAKAQDFASKQKPSLVCYLYSPVGIVCCLTSLTMMTTRVYHHLCAQQMIGRRCSYSAGTFQSQQAGRLEICFDFLSLHDGFSPAPAFAHTSQRRTRRATISLRATRMSVICYLIHDTHPRERSTIQTNEPSVRCLSLSKSGPLSHPLTTPMYRPHMHMTLSPPLPKPTPLDSTEHGPMAPQPDR
jgi:hypothetical protein